MLRGVSPLVIPGLGAPAFTPAPATDRLLSVATMDRSYIGGAGDRNYSNGANYTGDRSYHIGGMSGLADQSFTNMVADRSFNGQLPDRSFTNDRSFNGHATDRSFTNGSFDRSFNGHVADRSFTDSSYTAGHADRVLASSGLAERPSSGLGERPSSGLGERPYGQQGESGWAGGVTDLLTHHPRLLPPPTASPGTHGINGSPGINDSDRINGINGINASHEMSGRRSVDMATLDKYKRSGGSGGRAWDGGRSPLKASHRLPHQDTDSGISNTSPLFKPIRCDTPMSLTDQLSPLGREVDALNSSAFRPSAFSASVPDLTSSRLMTSSLYPPPENCSHNLKAALDNSEGRRSVLVDKLRDAKDTIQLQARRMTEAEDNAKEATFEAGSYKYKEMDYRKKIGELERERQLYQDKTLANLRAREDLQTKLEKLTAELSNLHSSNSLLDAECRRKQDVSQHTSQALNLLEDENQRLNSMKQALELEIAKLKETLELMKSKNEFLESQVKNSQDEINRLRQESQDMSRENKALQRQSVETKHSALSLKEENTSLNANMKLLTEERDRLSRQLQHLEFGQSDLQGSLTMTAGHKDRLLAEKFELQQKVHSLTLDRETANRARQELEDQVSQLTAEVTAARKKAARQSDERQRAEEELATTKKMNEVLALELAGTKKHLDKVQEQVAAMDRSRQMARQQQTVHEQEVHGLEGQLVSVRKSLESAHRDHQAEQSSQSDHLGALQEELRVTKAERAALDLTVHELEAKLQQCEQNLRDHSSVQQRELESWRASCEGATSALGQKEAEVHSLAGRIGELQEQAGLLRVDHEVQQLQQQELSAARDELSGLREDKRRLVQESAENQQVIQLLEMQKNILSKASEGSMTRAQDLKMAEFKVEQLTTENGALRDQQKEVVQLHDEQLKEKERRLAEAQESRLSDAARREELEAQANQLQTINTRLTEQLTNLQQENSVFKSKQANSVSKVDYHRLEQEAGGVEERLAALRQQYDGLDQRHQQLLTDHSQLTAAHQLATMPSPELSTLRAQQVALEDDVSRVTCQLSTADGRRAAAEAQIQQLKGELHQREQRAADDVSHTQHLQRRLVDMETEVEDARGIHMRQEALINALKEQSLDAVSEELTQMRSELQKLLEVIQVKDEEIDELERQMRAAREQVTARDRAMKELQDQQVPPPGDGGQQQVASVEAERDDISRRLTELQEKHEALTDSSRTVSRERDLAVQDAADLRDGLDDLQQMFDEDRAKLLARLERDLRAKDRQIESLEEQLSRTTNVELKKLKRDASKVELLKRENMRLQWQLGGGLSTSHPLRDAANETTPFEDPEWVGVGGNSDVGVDAGAGVEGGVGEGGVGGVAEGDEQVVADDDSEEIVAYSLAKESKMSKTLAEAVHEAEQRVLEKLTSLQRPAGPGGRAGRQGGDHSDEVGVGDEDSGQDISPLPECWGSRDAGDVSDGDDEEEEEDMQQMVAKLQSLSDLGCTGTLSDADTLSPPHSDGDAEEVVDALSQWKARRSQQRSERSVRPASPDGGVLNDKAARRSSFPWQSRASSNNSRPDSPVDH